MTDIALALIKPNPFRDFDLHPIDDAQVEKLTASIDADGFWASVVARQVENGYEIAFGHHRVAAAKLLKRTAIPVEVRELSDWQMVRMLASENATQRGSTAAACIDAVAAISRVLAYHLLRWDEATFAKNLAKVGVDYPSCRGRLENGGGIGRSCIAAFAPKDAFSRAQIEMALGILKDSGRMATIVAEAQARAVHELHAEQAAAERQLAEAERRQAAAKTKQQQADAAKHTKKAQREAALAKKTTEAVGHEIVAANRSELIFDARCAPLFKLDSHLAVYRQIVTGTTFRSYLPLNQQLEFAKQVLAGLREALPAKEITARDIRAECWSRIETGLGLTKGKLRTAPERPYLEEIKEGLNMLRRSEGDFKRGIALLLRGFQLGEQLNAKQAERLDKTEALFTAGWVGIKPHRENVKRHLKLIKEE